MGELGAFTAHCKPSALLLRRALLAIDVPPGMLAWARLLIRRPERLACCSRPGVNDPATPHFGLRRVEVRGTDSLFRFPFMVWSGRRPGRRKDN
jgi:hypothetical protein